MISFFKNIRQLLLAENKFSKYLLYAIGEIILVVIGILIALKVNNWDQLRKIRIEEHNSLERLHDESENIVKYLKKEVERSQNRLNSIDQSAKALHNKSLDTLNEENFAFGIYSVEFYPAITPPKNVFEELKSTGKIQNIQSETVAKSISDYYEFIEYINTQMLYFRNNVINENVTEAAGDSFIYTYDESLEERRKPFVDFENLCNNNSFISKHVKALRDQIVFNNYRRNILKLAISMHKELSEELNINCDLTLFE